MKMGMHMCAARVHGLPALCPGISEGRLTSKQSNEIVLKYF